MKIRNRKIIIIIIVLLITCFLSIGFSAFQKQLLIDDSIFNVRLQVDTRVSGSTIQKTSGNAVSNSEDYNVKKIYGNVTFPTTSSYVLYKVDLTNYGNVKTGLLNITSNTSGINYSICDSNGNNCTSDPKTSVCNGSNCTLGSTKTIYVKVTSTSTGTKNVDLDLEFSPIHTITYENFNENTTSFKTDIMEGETYEVTLSSSPEEVSGVNATASYNKTNHKLTISGATNNVTVTAKYLLTDIAEESYTGSNPNNYVRYGTDLYRIITKGTIDDGYGNEELRTKIISSSSIGGNKFDDSSNDFGVSSLAETLNTTYYNSLSTTQKELIDTALWTESYTNYIGIINSSDYTNNSGWLGYQYTLTPGSGNSIMTITTSGLVESQISYNRDTYPTMYLSSDVLTIGGSGTSTDPYLLEKKSDGLQSNPTTIKGRELTVNGSSQPLVTVENKVGTPRYSTTTILTSSNYTSGSTTVPTASATGTYTIYYYIPAMDGFKAKQGSVTTKITGVTYTINYTKGDNISEIGKTSDTCTTSGTSLTCNVTLPSITPASGWENGKWNYNSNQYNPGSSFTLNSSNTGLTMSSSVTGKTYTATIYYYNGSAVATTARTCTVSTGNSCTFTLTTAVTGSKGVYNSAYKGIASATNSMTSAALSMTQDTTFYAIYSGSVSNRYRGTSSYTTRTLYRNEFFKSNTALDVRLATANNSTTNYTPESGIGGSTWVGLSTSNDTTAEYNSVETAAASTSTSLNTIYQFSITYEKGSNVNAIGKTGDTCKVTSATSCNVTLPSITPNTGYTSVGWSATNGSTTGVTGTYTISTSGQTLYANATGSIYTATFYYFDGTQINTTTSSCTVANTEGNCTVSVPVAVQSSTGPYGSPYKGVSSSASTMEAGSLTISTNGTKFYANYSSGDATNTKVTRYYYSSGYKSNTIYRNEYFISDNAISTVLSTADNGTTNYTSSKGPGSSNWLGLSTAQDTTPEYSTVQAAANSTSKTFYTVYQFVINYQQGANVSAIGSDSATCNVTTSDESCSVILPTITPNTGYTSVGWSTENGATSGQDALTTYTLTANNRVLYANAIAANYLNTTINEAYATLKEAFSSVANNQTIKVLNNTTETTGATLASTKTGIKLDLNGKTITMDNTYITNSGTLDIYNTSSVTGTISGTYYGLYNGGIATISGVTITGSSSEAINNQPSGYLEISGSSTQITSLGSSTYGISNSGTAIINGGTITGSSGISNYGTATINGGTITGSSSYGIRNSGTATIIGGTIQSSSSHGIYVSSGATLTLGANDSSVSTSSPLVQTTGTSNKYGVYVYSGGIFNFYDGIIKSSSGTGKSISGTVADTPNDYVIRKSTTDGIESATLGALVHNYQNTTTSLYYETLNDAFNAVANNQTIKVLRDITETTQATLASGKTGIKLDLNGKTITMDNTDIINSGTLDIYNTSSGAGTINGGSNYVLYNSGTLTLNGTSSTNKIVIDKTANNNNSGTIYNNNSESLTINNNVEVKVSAGTSSGIFNRGASTISGGTITGSAYGINNQSSGQLNISGSSTKITGTTYSGIVTYGTATIAGGSITCSSSTGISNSGTLTISGGTITGSSDGIINQPAGQLNISGNTTKITGTSFYGIYNSGTATITGGTIQSSGNHGINVYNGSTLTLGTKDSNVSTTSPLVQTTSTSNKYGVYVNSGSTFNFYDGIIKSSSGTGYSIYGTVSDTPDTYYVYKETTDGVESAFLAHNGLLMAGIPGDQTTSFLRTNIAKQDIESITFVNSISGHTPNGVNCFDVSKDSDESVLAWTIDSDSDGLYEITIGSYGMVYATDGKDLFSQLTNLTTINGMQFFDTSNVTDMSLMFSGCSSLTTLDLTHSNFDTSNVTTMTAMFEDCNNLTTLDLTHSNFDTSNVTDMMYMFLRCSSLTTLDLTHSNFDTSNVDNMTGMFNGCSSLTSLDLTHSNFDTSNVTTMLTMFKDCSSLTTLDLTYSNFDTSNVNTMAAMFYGCTNLAYLDLTGSNFNTSIVTNMNQMFYECTNLAYLDLTGPNFNTSNVTSMSNMFYGCTKLVTIHANSFFDTSSVTNSVNMFRNCTSLVGGSGTTYNSSYTNKTYARIDSSVNAGYFTGEGGVLAIGLNAPGTPQDVEKITFQPYLKTPSNYMGSWDASFNSDNSVKGYYSDNDNNGKVELIIESAGYIKFPQDSSRMFYYYAYITSYNGLQFVDTSNVVNMNQLFYYNAGITSLDLSSWDTSNVVDMTEMFWGCNSLTDLNISHFDTSNVTKMIHMFSGCSSLTTLDISSFVTNSLTESWYMFTGCENLRTIYASNGFNIANVTNSTGMFNSCISLIGGQNTTYDDNHIDASYAHIDGGSSNPGYFTDRNATIINGAGTLLNISNDIMSGSKSITNFINNLNKE